MNAPFVLAQLSAPTAVAADAPKSLKLGKPNGGQAVTVRLDGATRLDFTGLGDEKLTFVRIGSRLIILFDNQSTVTVEPVFDQSGKPLADIGFAMGADRTLSGEEFATLFPVGTDQSVLPAAGTPGAPSIPAGANFGSAAIDALSGGNPLDLLGNELGDGGFDATDLGGQNTTPIAEGADTVLVNEDGLSEGNPFGAGDEGGTVTSVSGSLNINFGVDAAGRSFSFPISQPGLAGLTSGGQPVQLLFTTIDGQPALIGYIGSDPFDPAGQVFTISLDALSTISGTYTFTLLQPLDHPITGTEDTLTLNISVTATDGSGDAIQTSISIGVNDDTPVLLSGPAFRTAALEDEGAADADTTVVSGSLGISFGSDNGNSSINGGQSGGAVNGDRAVVFVPGVAAPAGLTSFGESVQYVLLGNGTVLVAYTGSVVPSDAAITAANAGENIVFFVRLSDQAQGGFEFTLVRPLDHEVAGVEDDLALSFGFVATDGDGDPVAGSFSVTVNDDAPVFTAANVQNGAVDEEGLPGGIAGASGSYAGSDLPGIAITANGGLGLSWGADDNNSGATNNRSLAFAGIVEGSPIPRGAEALLSSNGDTIFYHLTTIGGQPAVVGYTGESPELQSSWVFTVTLDDSTATGSYTFTLLQPIDHPIGGTEDDLTLDFGFIATDSDGDSVNGSFNVSIDDDAPEIGAAAGGGRFTQSFDNNAAGFLGADDGWDGSITLLASGQNGIVTLSGSGQYALLQQGGTGPFTRFDGYSDNFNNGFTASVDIYLDPARFALGEGFDYSVAINKQDGSHLRDFIFHVTMDSSTGELLIGVSNNTGFDPVETLETGLHAVIGSAGWYTLRQVFHDQGDGSLAVDLQVLDAGGTVIFTQTLNNPADRLADVVGGSRYGWFTNIDVAAGIAVDNVSLTERGGVVREAGLPEGSDPAPAELVTSADLAIAWGADNGNLRSVQFSPSAAPIGLTADGLPLVYVVSDGGTVLTAYRQGEPQVAANRVFEVTLSEAGNGSYTFTLFSAVDHPPGGGDRSLVFSYTATDSDGDVSAPASFSISIVDDAPTAGTQTAATLDDDALAGGNDGGIGDANGVSTTTGTLIHDYKADGAGTVLLTGAGLATSASTEGAFFQTLSGDGRTLTISQIQDGLTVAVITVQLADASSGNYTVTLTHPVRHAPGGDENDAAFTIGYQVTDFDTDTATGSISINIDDDTPVVTGTIVTAIADEDDIDTNLSLGSSPDDGNGDGSYTGSPQTSTGPASVTGSIAFVVSFGADGLGANGGFSFTSTAAATLAGLGLQSKGAALRYVVNGETLSAYVDVGTPGNGYSSSDRRVFTLSIDQTTGEFAFNLYDQLDHVSGNGQAPTLVSSVAGLSAIDFGAVLRATDSDGDVVALNGALKIAVTDDIPVPVIVTTGASTTIDETAGIQNDDVLSGLASLFTTVSNPGTDTDLGGPIYARNPSALVSISPSASGADEAATQTLSLRIEGGNGIASGLTTTDGQSISLYAISSTLIVGRVGGESGPAAFAITIDQSGRVSIAQYLSLHHGNTGSADESVNLGNLISAVVTATDFDGDTVLASTLIGSQIRFEDDGPRVIGSTVRVTADEDDISNALSQGNSPNDGTADGSSSDYSVRAGGDAATVTGSIGAVVSFGADGQAAGGGFGFASNAVATMTALGLSSKGGALSYVILGDTILAYVDNGSGGYTSADRPVFALQLNDSTGAFSFQLYDQLDHVAGNGQNTALRTSTGSIAGIDFGAIIEATDGDGDRVDLDGRLIVTVTDDIPEISIVTSGAVTIDESAGNQDDDSSSQSVRNLFNSVGNRGSDPDLTATYARDDVVNTSVSGGADDIVATTLALRIDGGNGTDSGLRTTAGDTIRLYLEGGLVVGRVGNSGGAAAFAVTIESNGNVSVAQFLSLRHSNTGSTDESVDLAGKISAVLTATDHDGDVVSQSLSIGNRISFDDDGPQVGSNDTVLLDDDNLFGGNSGGVGDNPAPVNATGTLSHDFGADGGAIAWLTTGAPSGFSYQLAGNNLQILQGTTLVVTVTLNPATGAYTVTQNAPVLHATGNNENNQPFDLTYRVTDGDGDRVTGTLSINVDDDTPVVTGTIVTATADEDDIDTTSSLGSSPDDGNGDGSYTGSPQTSTGPANVTGSIAQVVSFGADGLGANGGFSFTGTAAATLAALGLQSKGAALRYVVNGETLTAYVDVGSQGNGYSSSDRRVFTLSVDRTTGEYAFNLYDQLDHVSGNGQAPTLVSSVAGLSAIDFGAVLRATDSDGDVVALTGTLKIAVTDDIPVPVIVTTGASTTIDETAGIQNDDVLSGLASLFATVSNPGTDTDLGGPIYARNPSALVSISPSASGADEAATQTLSLRIEGGNGIASGLTTTEGQSISLYAISSTLIVGRIAGGDAAFAITIDQSGRVSIAQYLSLKHGNTGSADEAINLGNLISAVVTATDFDGDTVQASTFIGSQIRFEDDGPQVGANALVQTDEDAAFGGNPGGNQDDVDAVALTGTLAHDGGADGTASVLWSAAGVTLPSGFLFAVSAGGTVMTITQDQGNGYVPVLTLTITNAATGAYSVAQVAPIDHPQGTIPGTEDNVQFTVSYVVTDGDGDTAIGTISVNVDDDSPTVGANALIQLDDDALAGGNAGGIGDEVETAMLSGVLSHSGGADGTASVLWAPNGINVPFGFWFELSADSKTMTITQNQNGTYVGVFRATITDPATGAYQITQLAPVLHNTPGTEDNAQVSFQYRVTDGDGDVATGTLTVNVDDDTPTVGVNALIQLDDDALAGGNAGGVGDEVETAVLSGVLSNSGGADGTTSVLWAPNGISVPFGFWFELSADSKTMTITQNQNGTYVGVFRATITDPTTGAYQITQLASVKHNAPGTEDNAQISFQYRVTDGDGDVATGTLTVNVDDDTPTASPSTTVWLDDEDLAGGNPGGIDDQTGTPTNLTGMLNHSFGADSDGASMSWLATSSSNADSLGFTYEVTNGGNTLLVKQGGTLVFTATMNQQTGAYAITQNAPIDHPAGGDENEVVFQLRYQVTDGDGDTAQSYLWVKVDDDTPTGGAGTTAWLDDDSLAGGNPGGVGDDALANTSNVLKHSFGADGPGGIAWTGITVTSGGNQADFSSQVSPDGKTLQVYQNNTLVITATLNPLTGQYSLVHNAPIDHVAGGDENQIQFQFRYNVTDGDGDAAAGYIWVNVDDDTPTGGAGTTAWLDDDSLAGGNPDGVGDDALANTSNVLKHSFGADGPGGIAWTGITVTSGGNQADFSSQVSPDGKTLQVYQNNTLVITATLNPLTGQYSLVHNAPIDHVAGADENQIQFQFRYNVTDGDGDAAAGYIWVNVDDDTPTGGAGTTAWLDDDSLAGGNPDGVGDDALANTSNVLKHSFGADGPGGIAWTGITVTSGGNQADFSSQVSPDGKTLQVYQNNTLVITATLNPLTGQYSLVHNAPIDHVAGGDENQIQFQFLYNVTDGDGDAAAGYIWVNVDDDTPTASPSTTVWLDDEDLAGGNPGGIDDQTGTPTNLTGMLNHSFGADSDGASMSWLASSSSNANGLGFTYEVTNGGNTLLVKQGGTLVFTATMNQQTGAYAITQNAPIDHPAGGDENEVVFQLRYQVTDGDGDTAQSYLWVKIDDDTPTAADVAGSADENQTVMVALDYAYGADGAGTVTLGAPASDPAFDLSGLTINLVGNSVQIVPGSTFDSLAVGQTATLDIPYTTTDGDQDAVTRNVTVTIIGTNDAPVITGGVTTATVFEAGDLDAVAANEASNNRFEPHVNIDSFLAGALVSGVDMAALLVQVQTQIGPQASFADAIATVWDYIDDNGGYYNNLLNEMAARLGVEYADYLQDGGKPLLDVAAKYQADGGDAGTAPDRLQSLHDNLLGNLHGPSLIDRMLGAGQGSNPNPIPAVYNDIVTLLGAHGLGDLLNRPIYSGNEGAPNLALAWDQASGLVPVAAGQMTASDVDAGAVLTWSGTAAGTYGSFAISASGAWSYTLNNADPDTQGLREGQTVTESFIATVIDEHGATAMIPITITIKGANDAPEIGWTASIADLYEPTGTTGGSNVLNKGGSFAFGDVDVGDTHTAVVTQLSSDYNPADLTDFFGTFTAWIHSEPNNAALDNGELKWNLAAVSSSVDFLAAGQTITQTYRVDVVDSAGAVSSRIVTAYIIGTNDAPVISATSVAGAVLEPTDVAGIVEAGAGGGLEPVVALSGAALTLVNGLQPGVDAASFATAFAAVLGQAGGNQGRAIATLWDALDDAYGAAGPNQININESFTRLGMLYAEYLQDGGMPLTEVTAKFTADNNNDGIPQRQQSLHDNLLGNLTAAALQQRYAVADPTLHAELTAAIAAIDPDLLTRPYFEGSQGQSDSAARAWDLANGFIPSASGSIGFGDVDLADSHTVSAAPQGANYLGNFTAAISDASTGDGTGSIAWTFTVDPSAIDYLAAGQTLTQTYTVTLDDGHGGTDTVPVTITITGTNDAPTISAATPAAAINEDPASNPGTPVSALLGNAADVDGTVNGIAVVGQSVTGGHWQYSTNGGSTWSALSTDPQHALVLGLTALVRFVPDLNVQTTTATTPPTQIAPPSLTFHAWDGSSGQAGDIVDLSASGATGGGSAYSSGTGTSVLTITNVVDQVFTEGNDLVIDLQNFANDPAINANWFEDGNYLNALGGDDIVILPDSTDALYSHFQGQTFDAGDGADSVTGGDGADHILGGTGDDSLAGMGGTDILEGGAGDDLLSGGSENDRLFGGADDDTLSGGSGKDFLQGDAGDDVLNGGSGIDTANYATNLSAADFSYNQTQFRFEINASASGEGADQLHGIEVVTTPSQTYLLVGGNPGDTGFATISEAMAFAATLSGPVTILVAPGVYNENVVISRGDLTLLSLDGRGTTSIVGQAFGAENATITVLGGLDHVKIGGAGAGFTIIGFDNGNPAIENAAVYVRGGTNPTDGFELVGNDVRANGDLGLLSDWNAPITNAVIQGNIFSGQTFTGSEPGGPGDQFTVANSPRQLVAFGQGSDPATNPATNIQFTNNEITGTAGGLNANGEQGNSLVTIDASNSIISSNSFTGFTNGTAYDLRVRGTGTNVVDNNVDHDVNNSEAQGFYVDNHGVPGTYTGNVVDGGPATEILFGTPGADTISGDVGNDAIVGGLGSDHLSGGAGNDTFYELVGDGRDTIDGNDQTVADTYDLTGTGAGENFFVEIPADYNTRVNPDYAGTAEILVSNGTSIEAELTNIEEIVIHGGGGADTLTVSGSFTGTALLTSTITFDAGEGDDTIDVSDRTSPHRVVSDGGIGNDSVELGFDFGEATYTKIFAPGTTTLIGVRVTHGSGAGQVTDVFTNYESFNFGNGETRTLAQLFAPVVTSAADGSVTEDFTSTIPTGDRVTNGSFEGPTSAARLSGWTTTNIQLLSEPHTGGTSVGAYQTVGTASQTLQTIAGVTYNIRFWASNPFDNGLEVESLNVSWGGQTVFALGNLPPSGGYRNFTEYSFNVVATSASTAFSIAMQDTQGWWVLDDVSVRAVVNTAVETATGTIGFTDTIGESHSVTYTPAAGGYYGTFTPTLTNVATDDGTGTITWNFTVNNADIQQLAAGQTLTQTYTVRIDDGLGGVTTQDVDILLNGTNDAPVAVGETVQMIGTGAPPATATSTPIFNEVESNNSRATANVIDRALLNVAPNSNLTDPADPAITVKGSIASTNAVDYFAITLKAGETLTLDIDNTTGSLDSKLWLFNSGGTQVAYNDDSSAGSDNGSPGSDGELDSYLTYTAAADGVYYIQVGRYSGSGPYDLQVSIDNFKWFTAPPLTISAATLLANDYDIDAVDTLTIVSVSGNGVALVGNNVVVQPGVTSFTYTVSDNHGAQSTATVVVNQVVNQAPSAVAFNNATTSIAENASTASPIKVADIAVTDDALGSNALTLTGADAASFQIIGNALYLKAGVSLDYETKTSYNVTVNVDDATVGGNPDASQAFTLNVTNINEAPVISSGTTATVAENTAVSNVVYQINASDVDAGTTLTYSLTGADAARFNVSASGAVTFKVSPDFETPTDIGGNNTYDIIVHANDGTNDATKAVAIAVTNVNELPVARADDGSVNAAFQMTEDTVSKTFNVLANDTLDGDAGASNNITLGTVTIPANSYGINASDLALTVTADNQIQVQLLGTDWNKLSNGAFMTLQINYVLHGDQPSDTSQSMLLLKVTGVNDAPVLDASFTPTISENQNAGAPVGGVTVGTAVSDLVDLTGGGGLNNVTDVDGFVSGIAITAVDSSHGTWYWSPNNGTSWVPISSASVSETHALLLYSNYNVYFAPAPGYAGNVSDALTFRAWDRSSGTPGSYANASVNGGSTPFSTATDTVSLTISDTTAPTVSSESINGATGIQNNTLNAGDVVSIAVNMSEVVIVSGTPRLALNIGGSTVQADYVSGSGTSVLVFTYTILAGQTDGNGISINANALSLNGGTISDPAGNQATLTAVSVGDNASYKVDTTAPAVVVNAVTADNIINAAEQAAVVTVSGTNEAGATVTLNGNAVVVDSSTTWHYTLSSQAIASFGQGGENLIIVATDAAGNTTTVNKSISVDTVAPTVSVTMSDSALTVGETSTVTITLSEAVTGFDNTDVTVENGTLTTLTSANGGITWTGVFTPTPGISDTTNVITVAATYTDVAGNAGTAGSSANYMVNTVPLNAAPQIASHTDGSVTEDATTNSNLVTNPGFESSGGGTSGWTKSPNNDSVTHGGTDYAHSGRFGGAIYNGSLSQTLTTVAGQHYKVSFWVAYENGSGAGSLNFTPSTNSFVTNWGGAAIAGSAITATSFTTISPTGSTVGSYGMVQYTYDVVATGASTVLSFAATSRYDSWAIDDVSVTAVANRSTSGTVKFIDVDTADTHDVSFTPAGVGYVGAFAVSNPTPDSTGGVTGTANWTFTASDTELQFLAAGQSLVQTYNIAIDDHNGHVTTEAVKVTLVGKNDAPVIVAGNATQYIVGSAAVAIAPNATITDIDSANFGGGSLVIRLGAWDNTKEVLSIQNQGTGVGQIGVSGSTVSYGGTAIGTFAVSTSGTDLLLTVSLNAAATPDAVQALMHDVYYSSTLNANFGGQRVGVSFTLVDGDGTASGGTDTAIAYAEIDMASASPFNLTTSSYDQAVFFSGMNLVKGTIGSGGTATYTSNDTLHGGIGTDTIEITNGGTISDSLFTNTEGFEALRLSGTSNITVNLGSNARNYAFVDGLTIDHGGLAGVLTVTPGTSGNMYNHDMVVIGGTANDVITSGSGNDTIIGGAGNDAINTGTGNDVVVVNAVVGTSSDSGRVQVVSNNNDTGQDTITGFNLSADTLRIVATNVSNFEHGTDTAIGTASGGVDNGTPGSFTTSTGLVNLSHEGTMVIGGGDVAVTFVSPSTTLTETNFEARLQYDLTGTSGADTIKTGALNDILSGGLGNDVLRGGAGADIFRFGESGAANADSILDYNAGQGDQIDLTGLLNSLYSGSQTDANVRLFDGAANNVSIQVDTDTSGGTNWQDVATLTGFDTGASDQVNLILNSLTNQTHTYVT